MPRTSDADYRLMRRAKRVIRYGSKNYMIDIDPAISFLKQLRDAAMVETNQEHRWALRDAADTLSYDLATLKDTPSFDNMRRVNGAWSTAYRLWKSRTPENTPTGGALHAPEEMKRAA